MNEHAWSPGVRPASRLHATRLALACVAALAVVIHTAPPLACSPWRPGLRNRSVIPFDNATSVATRTQIVVMYRGVPEDASTDADAASVGPLGSDLLLIEASTNTWHFSR